MPAIMAWIAGLGALAIPQSRAAQLITVNGTITVNADDGASFKAGDSFTYSFTFNDATTDTASQTFSGQFNAGVSAFSLVRGNSNTRTWDPAGGTFTVSPLSQPPPTPPFVPRNPLQPPPTPSNPDPQDAFRRPLKKRFPSNCLGCEPV